MNFFLSQRPRKSPPAVMSTSRETLCIKNQFWPHCKLWQTVCITETNQWILCEI